MQIVVHGMPDADCFVVNVKIDAIDVERLSPEQHAEYLQLAAEAQAGKLSACLRSLVLIAENLEAHRGERQH